MTHETLIDAAGHQSQFNDKFVGDILTCVLDDDKRQLLRSTQ